MALNECLATSPSADHYPDHEMGHGEQHSGSQNSLNDYNCVSPLLACIVCDGNAQLSHDRSVVHLAGFLAS